MLTVHCLNCGSSSLTALGSEGCALLLKCRCGTLATIEGVGLLDSDGCILEADALPEALRPIGQDEDDPWVWLKVRLKRSQRELVQRAHRKLAKRLAAPGRVKMNTALEYLSADFLAGA